MARYYRSLMRHVVIPREGASTTHDTLGAALWVPPGTGSMTLLEQVLPGLRLLPEGAASLRKGMRWERYIDANTPDEPHWQLKTLSVAPVAQRRGVGSALVRPGLDRADKDGVACYVLTQRRANIPFYRRFGFEEVGELSLAENSPTVWQMWREPALV